MIRRPLRRVGATLFLGVAALVTVLWARVLFPSLWRMQTLQQQ